MLQMAEPQDSEARPELVTFQVRVGHLIPLQVLTDVPVSSV